MKKPEVIPIEINDTERKIYLMYQNEKSNRFLNVFKILLLRHDYYDLLSKLKQLHYTDPELEQVVEHYLGKLSKTEYLKKLSKYQRDNFLRIARNLFRHYYPLFMFKNIYGKQFKGFIFDPTLGFPNIYFSLYPEPLFQKYFHLFTDKLGNPANQLDYDYSNFETVANEPMTVQITFDNTTKKEELISFIDKHWKEISAMGKFPMDKSRDKSSKTFLRDIDIYNAYILSDGKTSINKESQVMKMFNGKDFITDLQVRKSYQTILKFYKAINSEG